MQKPITPKKPSKRDLEPKIHKTVQKILLLKGEEVYLISYGDKLIFGWDYDAINWEKLGREGFELIGENELTWSIVNKIHEKVNCDFKINSEVNRDAYFEYWFIEYSEPNPNYENEIKIFKDRFNQYEKDYLEYLAQKEVYNKHLYEQSILKLKSKIKKLESSL